MGQFSLVYQVVSGAGVGGLEKNRPQLHATRNKNETPERLSVRAFF
jgi:hypothetical protein